METSGCQESLLNRLPVVYGEDMALRIFYCTLGKSLHKLAPMTGDIDSYVCVYVFSCVLGE